MSEASIATTEAKTADSTPETRYLEANFTPLYKERLRQLKDNYSDKTPEHEIHGNENPDNLKYKVLKGAWWVPMLTYLQIFSNENLIVNEKLAKGVKTFIENYTSNEFLHKDRKITPGDIKKANAIIGVILASELRPYLLSLPSDSPRAKEFKQFEVTGKLVQANDDLLKTGQLKQSEEPGKTRQFQHFPKPEQTKQLEPAVK